MTIISEENGDNDFGFLAEIMFLKCPECENMLVRLFDHIECVNENCVNVGIRFEIPYIELIPNYNLELKNVLDETQNERDSELAFITGESLSSIRSYGPEVDDGVGLLRNLMRPDISKDLESILRGCTELVCLDFGSGICTNTIALMENDNHVYLADNMGKIFSTGLKRIAKRGFGNKIKGIINKSQQLQEDFFDVIIVSDFMGLDKDETIEKLRRSLKKDGIFYVNDKL